MAEVETSLAAGIERILFTEIEIAEAIDLLAERIARDYHDREITLVGILKGAVFVTADLARALARRPYGPSDVQLDFIAVTSYGAAKRTSGEVRLIADTTSSLEDRHVVIVEDIVDNGLTLAYLRRMLGGRAPASLAAAVLLDKPQHRVVDVPIEYAGLTCPDAFVVGYGLDHAERYRALPYIGVTGG